MLSCCPELLGPLRNATKGLVAVVVCGVLVLWHTFDPFTGKQHHGHVDLEHSESLQSVLKATWHERYILLKKVGKVQCKMGFQVIQHVYRLTTGNTF